MSKKTYAAVTRQAGLYGNSASKITVANSAPAIRTALGENVTAGRALIAAIKADMLDNRNAAKKAIAKLRADALKAKAREKAARAKARAKKAGKRVVSARSKTNVAQVVYHDVQSTGSVPARGSELGRGQ